MLVVFDTLQMGAIVLSPDLTVETVNAHTGEFLDLPEDEIVGAPISSLWGDSYSQLEWLFPVVQRRGEARKCTVSLEHSTRQRLYLILTVAPLEDNENDERLLLAITDITEHYQDLLRSLQTEKTAAVGLLAAGIAHEFNNIWASIQGYAELARQDKKFQADLVDVALEHSARSSEIIHSLLSFSDRPRVGEQILQLGNILKSILHLIDMELRAKKVTPHFEMSTNPPVLGNEGMLQQVFLNLLTNAFQAISGKGDIFVSLCEEEGFAVVCVRDTGSGLSSLAIKRLFDPFYTTKGALGGSDEVDGQGLGLTLSRNFIAAHGGDINVDSELGVGTKFTVRIPVAPAFDIEEAKNLRAVARANPQIESVGRSDLRILVVDDEPALHSVLRGILEGHSLTCVSTCQEARELLATEKYDALLLDLILNGDDDGFAFFDEITAIYPELSIVFITGRAVDEKLSRYAERAAGLICKPFSVNELSSLLANLLKK